MSEQYTLIMAEHRTAVGKGSAHKIRAAGQIPAVIYGLGAEAEALTIDPLILLKALATDYRRNTLLNIQVGLTPPQLAKVQEIQRTPGSGEVVHVDFLRIDPSQSVIVQVPVHFTGRAAGERAGGKLNILSRKMKIKCLPTNIPAFIEFDLTLVDAGQTIMASQVPLPSGVEAFLRHDHAMLNCKAVQVEVVEEEQLVF